LRRGSSSKKTPRRRGGSRKEAAAPRHPARDVESPASRRALAERILARLRKAHPDARCTLDFTSPFELLIATILAAQCTDETVNRVTPELFRRYPTAGALAAADGAAIEELVRPTGFFRNKARSIRLCSAALVERHNGEVPRPMEELTALPGVGRKTANVVRGVAFGEPAIIVDTHFRRVSSRLGLHAESDPDLIEAEVSAFMPRESWTELSHVILFHGRRTCSSRKPDCPGCVVSDLCSYPDKTPDDGRRG
jgi:endonuclease-3